MTDLAKLVVRLEAETGRYQAELEKANRQLGKFAKDQDALFGKLAGTFAAFFTVQKLQAWGSRILETADNVGKLSERTGIATESLSKLIYAFEQNNVSGESLTTMLRKLNQNLSEAAGNAESEAAIAFKALGIEVKTATGEVRRGDEVLADIADRFSNYADGANKSAIATKLLGKTGEEAIPALNGGAEGLKRLGDEAERVGRVISEDLAQQADEFNDRLDRLKSTLIDGIGNRVAAELLPTLNALGEEFENTANKGLILERTSEAIATLIKGLTDIALGTSTSFLKLGNAIGGVGAAAVAAAELDFERAGDIIDQATKDNLALEAEYQKARAALWREGGAEILEEIKITAKKVKEEAPNLAGSKEIAEATKKAIEKLKDMGAQLDEQVATFGKGDAAALKYRLQIGELSDTVKEAGASGQQLADSIIAQAEALEKLKNAKEIADSLAEVNAQILELKGNTAEAAIAEFDRKNAELVTKLRKDGNEEGLRQLETLNKLIVAQADFNELAQKADAIASELARNEDRIRNSREAGAISELEMQQQLGNARKQAAIDLAAINAEQTKIAEQAGNPALLEQAKQLGSEIENLKHQAELFGKSIQTDVESSFGSSLKMLVKDIHNADDAFASFIQNVADQLLELAIQQLSQQIIGGFANLGGGGSGGNWFATLAGAFAGGRASGGSVTEGMAYRVNEKTPNSEWFVPGRSGSVVPAHKMGGQTVSQTFIMQVQKDGTVTRSTQMQVGAQAAKGLQQANKRNN